jgi:O-antigen/teichoic acid export membrane protein
VTVCFLVALCSSIIAEALFPPGFNSAVLIAAVPLLASGTLNGILYAQIINQGQGRAFARLTGIVIPLEIGATLGFAFCWGVPGAVGGMVLGQILMTAGMIGVVVQSTPLSYRYPLPMSEVRKYYSYGATMFVAGFGAYVIDASDRMIMGKILPLAELGAYQVAYGFCAHAGELATPLFAVLMPYLVAAKSDGDSVRAKRMLDKIFRVLILMYAPVTLILSFQGRNILATLSTDQFVSGAAAVPWVVFGIAVYQVAGLYAYSLHSHRMGALITRSLLIFAAMNIALNLIFIPMYGIVAAAVTTTLAYTGHFLLLRHFSKRIVEIGPGAPFLVKIAVASLAVVISQVIVRSVVTDPVIGLSLGLAAGLCSYCAVIVASGAHREFLYGTDNLIPNLFRRLSRR